MLCRISRSRIRSVGRCLPTTKQKTFNQLSFEKLELGFARSYRVEVSIINEQAFVVRNGDDSAPARDELSCVVACAFADREGKFTSAQGERGKTELLLSL